MLAGLIFATEDADDRAGVLAATSPFGGLTLIEFQARLLIAAGVSQIVVVIARLTPELLGALNRIARRGGSVDTVRGAAEAADKLHPLAQVLVVADSLVTTADVVALLAGEDGDALLVADDRDAADGFERVGSSRAWAGLARLASKRIGEVAAMPRDYDFQSTLLRVAAQAGAAQIVLPAGSAGGAHGIERDSRALGERGDVILATLVSRPRNWADRFVYGPAARLLLPLVTARAVPTAALAGAGGGAALAALGALWFGWSATGFALVAAATLAFTIGAALAWLRDERFHARFQRAAIGVSAALAVLLLAHRADLAAGDATATVAAIALIAAAALAERAANDRVRRGWWASPGAYPLVMLPLVVAGLPFAALAAAALYAGVTLAAAIEALRQKP